MTARIHGVPACAPVRCERRQGMRARDGWVWGNWQPCTDAEAHRVTGLHSWQVRQYGQCAACAGTGRAPLGVLAPEADQPKGGA